MEEKAPEEFGPLPEDDAVGPSEATNAEVAASDPFEESVFAEVEKIRDPKGNWVQTLVILGISLLLFVGLGRKDSPIAFTVLLVGVLFVHEMGHYLGMRFFGYRNVRMFFIPLFGAAVSGQKTTAKSYQEAIVTLLGPLPGLFLAAALMGAAFLPGLDQMVKHYLIWASLVFGMLNGINLLPVFPLDGGRLLNQILFSRNRYLESVSLLLAAIALAAYGATQQHYFFLFLGMWIFVSVGATFKMNSIAQYIGDLCHGQRTPMNEPIPRPIFRAIVHQANIEFPKITAPKNLAAVVFRIWERMHVEPPGAVATTLLLLTYLMGCLLTLPWLIPFFMNAAKK